ncbi:MAG TPA: hypothetical protein PKO36_13585, partial [Candidatus Hydrogenedentes bacterium]|nr:hypothetical protein [Candidatus Hydrogenedentota bacterium]
SEPFPLKINRVLFLYCRPNAGLLTKMAGNRHVPRKKIPLFHRVLAQQAIRQEMEAGTNRTADNK